MGIDGLTLLVLALGCAFGILGVVLGLAFGVRTVQRDEARYENTAKLVNAVRSELGQLKIEWGTTLENLEQLAAAVEKGRRRIAASEARQNRAEDQQPEIPFEQLPPAQQRDIIRQRIRRIG